MTPGLEGTPSPEISVAEAAEILTKAADTLDELEANT